MLKKKYLCYKGTGINHFDFAKTGREKIGEMKYSFNLVSK